MPKISKKKRDDLYRWVEDVLKLANLRSPKLRELAAALSSSTSSVEETKIYVMSVLAYLYADRQIITKGLNAYYMLVKNNIPPKEFLEREVWTRVLPEKILVASKMLEEVNILPTPRTIRELPRKRRKIATWVKKMLSAGGLEEPSLSKFVIEYIMSKDLDDVLVERCVLAAFADVYLKRPASLYGREVLWVKRELLDDSFDRRLLYAEDIWNEIIPDNVLASSGWYG